MFRFSRICSNPISISIQVRNKTIRTNAPKVRLERRKGMKETAETLKEKGSSKGTLETVKTLESGIIGSNENQMRFKIERVNLSGMLPVYRQYRNGRTRIVTVIRRIQGDIQDFKKHLSLFIPSEKIKTGFGVTKINGDYADLVKKWLTLNKY